MAQAVRTRFVDERPRLRPTFPRDTTFVLVLLTLWLCVACAGTRQVAGRLGLSAHPNIAAFDLDVQELDASPRRPLHYRQDGAAPPKWEFEALEPENAEHGAGIDSPLIPLTLHFTPVLSSFRQALRIIASTRTARLLVSSALARAPPYPHR
jgi:hypothetical protein